MTIEEYIEAIQKNPKIKAGSPMHEVMHLQAQEAQKITAIINGGYHDANEIRKLFSRLIGTEVDEGFRLFPPFYTDFGRNIHLGKKVFINSGCCFQDQGGISIGDNVLIGHQCVLATINHDLDPERRGDMEMKRIVIERNVWIGSHATILPGVTIGEGSVVAAGAVVTKDVLPFTIVAGIPARPIRKIGK